MGHILIHAGMPRTGSSSIQRWLRDNAPLLAEHGIVAVRALARPDGRVEVAPGDARASMNSGQVWRRYRLDPSRRRETVAELLGGLEREARAASAVVISAEGFAGWFWHRDADFARELDRLASGHRISVAYYVRPQHTALEAAWRARGFRRSLAPSQFLAERSVHLDHLGATRFAREAAPRVRFDVRPFRADLLAGGDVVVDFARGVLGLEGAGGDGDRSGVWRNEAIPLELANALHGAPEEILELLDRDDAAPTVERLRGLAAGLDLPGSATTRLARLVLQQACHERFEPANLELIAELGWPAREWVPAVEEPIGEASFERLDELWRPSASAAELALLRAALGRVLEAAAAEGDGRRGNGAGGPH